MYTIIVLCAVIAATKGQVENEYSAKDTFYLSHTDNYMTLNKQHFMEVLSGLDTKLQNFNEHYLGRLEGINVQLDMVVANINQVAKRLSPMQLLDHFTKTCILKYRSTIPSEDETKAAITKCVSQANNEVNIFLVKAQDIKNSLAAYYRYHYDDELENCHRHSNTLGNQTACIMNVTNTTYDHTYSNQKDFADDMEAAECAAKAYLKKALDCSYSVLTGTISKIAQTNLLIDKCFAGEDECQPCDKPTCFFKIDMEVDYKSKTIQNPFYGDPDNPSCLMLTLVNKTGRDYNAIY